MSTWGQVAHGVMLETLIECRKAGKSPEETAKAIDAAYPFGAREHHHPYKAWLKVRASFFAQHGLPRKGGTTGRSRCTHGRAAWMGSVDGHNAGHEGPTRSGGPAR